MIITEISVLQKGKVRIFFDSAKPLILYRKELKNLGLGEQDEVDGSCYQHMYYEIVGKRAIKRAMHLLEKRDRTEWQLRKKLEEGQYPGELIDRALDYVKSYRYIDDDRYARMFVRLNQDCKSSGRIRADLLRRGICPDMIERALEEENETSQEALIIKLLEKKNYNVDTALPQETRKIYQFLIRRGFKSGDIMRCLHQAE